LSDLEGTPGTPGTPGKPGDYGFQPGSTYTFNELVQVTNNSEDSVEVTVDLDGLADEDGDDSGMDIDVSGENGDLLGNPVNLGPGETTWISFSFNVPDEWA